MKRLADQTHYEILEVRQDAGEADIEAAYERARTLYGPGSLATYTLMSPDEAALLTSRIEEARRTLLDPAARARYDAELDEAPRPKKPAASNGSPATALFGPLPPVIPALQTAPAPRPGPAPTQEVPPSPAVDAAPVSAAVLLAAAAEAAGPPGDRPAPILLQKEIPAAVPQPASTPAPLFTPVPATTPAPAFTPVPASAPAPAAAPEVPIPDGAIWTGEALRKVREARGITVHQIAERTKVTRHHVENIEADRFGTLPASVYLRGILLSLARELRLDGQKVARSYLERVAAAAGGGKPR